MGRKGRTKSKLRLGRFAYVALVLAALTAVGGYVTSQTPNQPVVPGQEGISPSNSIGQMAPTFEINSIDGERVALEDLAGKPVVLWFMAAWCPSCGGQARDLQAIQREFGDSIEIVAIDLWTASNLQGDQGLGAPSPETSADLERFREAFGGDWIWAMDTDQLTFRYGIVAVDSTILVDPDGIIAYRRNGPTGFNDLANAIARIL